MTPLERRYRSVLRLLPGPYRVRWEEDMVSALLDSRLPDDPEEAELAGLGRVGWREASSVVGLAVRLRLGGADSSGTARAWGDAVRYLALMCLALAAIRGTVSIVAQVAQASEAAEFGVRTGGFSTMLGLFGNLLSAFAFFAILGGARRMAVLALMGALLAPMPAAVRSVLASAAPDIWSDLARELPWTTLVLHGVALAAMAGFHRDAPPVRRRSWAALWVLVVALIGGAVVANDQAWWWTEGLLRPLSLLLATGSWAAVLYVAMACWASVGRRTTAAVLSAALTGPCMLTLTALPILLYGLPTEDALFSTMLTWSAAVTLLTTVVLTVAATLGLVRLRRDAARALPRGLPG